MQKAIIIQLEGVLSDDSKRRHLIDCPYRKKTVPVIGEDESYSTKSIYIKKDGKPTEWQPDYEAYHATADQDGVNEGVLTVSMAFDSNEIIETIFITDRPEKYRKQAKRWIIEKHSPYPYDEKGNYSDFPLFMRPDFLPWEETCKCSHSIEYNTCCDLIPDTRPYAEIKREIFEREILDKFEILFVLDRDEEPWKELGVQVLKVI